jgi:GTP diphosphokinase / guanosine-3',5'-bis(diphosphate) 3'-diphosphatase
MSETAVERMKRKFYAKMLENAVIFATNAHAGQTDRQKIPYILHPMRVSGKCWVYGMEHAIVGILHDVVEDCPVIPFIYECPDVGPTYSLENTKTAEILELTSPIYHAVLAITQNPGEDHQVYIERCCKDTIAQRVKFEDMQDNYGRLAGLKPEVQERLRARYIDGLRYVMLKN